MLLGNGRIFCKRKKVDQVASKFRNSPSAKTNWSTRAHPRGFILLVFCLVSYAS